MPFSLRQLFNNFIFGNIFISLCAVGMVFTTYLMNGLPISVTAFVVFIAMATYLLYNFHYYSSRLNFNNYKELKYSAGKISISKIESVFYLIGILVLIVSIFYLPRRVFFSLLPLILIAITYTIPFIKLKNRRVTLGEIPIIKTPVLAIVWGISTTVIPLVEQNISLSTSFIWMQVISRSLFIFALCIPFEIRDVDSDRNKNIMTLPVIYGIKTTKIIGTLIVFLELITHHFIPVISESSMIALDISSLVALIWIIRRDKTTGIYFYKFLVDGTMLVRFIFLFIAIHRL
jgi:4-hydroxybenzoate polyprenyltransferase